MDLIYNPCTVVDLNNRKFWALFSPNLRKRIAFNRITINHADGKLVTPVKATTPESFIDSSFVWFRSDEGDDFWNEVLMMLQEKEDYYTIDNTDTDVHVPSIKDPLELFDEKNKGTFLTSW